MFSHRLDQAPSSRSVLHWYLLSLNGGLINAAGFLATGRFVSHVTGFATLFGVDVGHHRFGAAAEILAMPLFFLLGSFLAGFLIDRPIHQKRRPHFDYVMGSSALCLFLAAWGGAILPKAIYVLLPLLYLACGLQNGAITSSSGISIRTTHLTGLMTDLGLGLARLITFRRSEEAYKGEALASQRRSGSILAFALGSVAGAWIFLQFGCLSFVLPGLIASYAAFHGRKAKVAAHREDLPEREAA